MDVFIDTDMGSDDWSAIALLACCRDVNIVGCSVTGCGLAYLDAGVQNLTDLLRFLKHDHVPVGRGAAVPSSFSNVFPTCLRENMSNMLGYDKLPHFPVDREKVPGAGKVLEDALASYPNLVYFSVGGFTNLYYYMLGKPSGFPMPRSLFVMGGAVHVRGNVNDLFAEAYPDNATAEWNIFLDPQAADYVINRLQLQGTPVHMVSIDACVQAAPLRKQDIDRLASHSSDNPVAAFLSYVLSNESCIMEERCGYPATPPEKSIVYDAIAAWVLLDQGRNTSSIPGEFSVDTNPLREDDRNLGRLLFKPMDTYSSSYANILSPDAFPRDFVDIICSGRIQAT